MDPVLHNRLAVAIAKASKSPSQDQRMAWAKEGKALSDGSWPIPNADYLRRAITSLGRGSKSSARIKAWIIKRAKALDLVSSLPSDWNVT